MFAASLLPGWSNPVGLLALVAVRLVVNLAVGLLAVRRFGSVGLLAVGAAVASTAITLAVLRPGGLGLAASRLEALLQLGLIVLAGSLAVRADRRLAVFCVVLALVALALLAVSLPIYGEATVAP